MLHYHIEVLSNTGLEGDRATETFVYASTRVSSPALIYIENTFVWWTVRESNSQSRLAKPMLSHLTNSPRCYGLVNLISCEDTL